MCSVFRGGIDLAVLETVCAERSSCAFRCWTPWRSWSTTACSGGRRRPGPPRGSRCWRPSGSSRPSSSRSCLARTGCVRRMRRRSGRWPRTCPARRRPGPGGSRPARTRARQLPCCAGPVRRDRSRARPCGLANRLTGFWSIRGHFSEGRRRLAELLERVPDDDPERVDALNGAAWLATDQGDRAVAVPLLERDPRPRPCRRGPRREATVLYYRGRATADAR